MEDAYIVQLYWQRDESAISSTAEKYGKYCTGIAMNILSDMSDAEECVNDTYLRAWNAMPPHRPNVLSAFLGKITRNLSINRYEERHAKKRIENEFSVSLDELAECVGESEPMQDGEYSRLGEIISAFLRCQPEDMRRVFVCRYFYSDSLPDIAARFHFSESKVKSILFRMRQKLKIYLESEGYSI